ncbi:Nudix family hydrolase [Thiothrix fructosivorans]|uniref:8-oxo-dGTP diphosphatase n=1 Tax=Thiothrix fructosivorans TaxID=111770 RepID=A0A8B0SED3_9GAMM|nr:Nudix family hydrolase [Thiothrix fructosivorans]MBO0614587.1 Nudix family hydrolase [Thiothrix fructosivorans]QTX09414.1 Nudix family hydrolase [Thiothrix fructosivorans]
MPNTAVEYLHVVAAVIRGNDGRILLAQRPTHQHQGGKWEFPGGKVESGETPLQGLSRELHEELGINVQQAHPLIKVRYVYPERAVLLDVWEVIAFSGVAHGREGQLVAWYTAEQLPTLEFPPANYPIITAARLPERCLITPEPHNTAEFLHQLEQRLHAGIRLVVFRAKSLAADDYVALAREVIALAHEFEAKVVLNSPPIPIAEADGLHLTSSQLWHTPRRAGQWLSASCHDGRELQRAAEIGVDFALLSPVLPTLSHPGAAHLGWAAFAAAVEDVNFPVYALGGMENSHVATARLNGGQGIAAIRSVWDGV